MGAGGMKRGEKILFWIFALMGVFAMVSFILLEVFRAHSDKALYPTSTHYDLSAEGLHGSSVVRKAGCTACHRVMRNGSVQYLTDFLKNPEATYPKETVDHGPTPKGAAYVAKLPEQDLHALVVFLSELKADQGSSAARLPADSRSGFIDEMVKVWAPDKWKTEYKDSREEVRTKEKEEQHDAGST